MTLHTEIANKIIDHYGERLIDSPKQNHDALTISLANDVTLEIRMASADEYSFQWKLGEEEFRIDTAPLHPDLPTFPNHLHHSSGQLRPDPLTTPGNPPWQNVERVLDSILENPLLA